MRDLTLISKRHQRYENNIPVMRMQFCGRAIKIENKCFNDLFKGIQVIPSSGFVITMYNMDTPNPTSMMQPKLMELVSDTGAQIILKGVTLKSAGVTTMDFKDYGLTLFLENRKVVKCTLHMYDRKVDIEYLDI